jgi:hypothetical protein
MNVSHRVSRAGYYHNDAHSFGSPDSISLGLCIGSNVDIITVRRATREKRTYAVTHSYQLNRTIGCEIILGLRHHALDYQAEERKAISRRLQP